MSAAPDPAAVLLASRARLMIAAAAMSVTVFTLFDLQPGVALRGTLAPLHAAQLAMLGATWLLLGETAPTRRSLVLLFFTTVTQAAWMIGLGCLLGDPYTAPLLLAAFSVAGAAVLPWGWRMQAAGGVVVLVASLAGVRLVTGSFDAVAGYPAYGVFVSQVLATLIAATLERARREADADRAALARSETRFRELVETVDAMVWEVALPSLELRFANRPAALAWRGGGGHADAEYRSYLGHVHPDDRARVEAAVAGWLRGQGHDHEIRFVGDDGRVTWMHERGSVVLGPDGQPVAVRGVAVDTTERHAAHRQAAQLAEILEASPWLVSTTDARGRARYTNPAGRRLLGLGADEDVSSMGFDEFLDPAEAKRLVEEVAPAAMRDGRWVGELQIRSRDGRRFPAEFVFLAHKGEDGRFRFFSSTARDISEERRAADEIRALNADLGRRVEARTRELEEALGEMAAFSYSVSHDLRAPLRRIDGFSALLSEELGGRLDERQADWLARIREGAQRMGALIDAQLKLARVSRSPLRREAVDLGAMALRVGAELAQAEKDREVELVVAPDLLVDADPELLRIALVNLMSNAWKFTRRQEHPRVEVGRRREGEEEAFYVRDNGVGFDMSFARKLFGTFERLHDEAEFEGTGVGLATVERIARRHGGRAWAEAAPGQGATFLLTLPSAPPP